MKDSDRERILKISRKGDLPVFSAILHRGGSGGGVIESVPSQKWLDSMQVLRSDGYMAYMRIVIDPSSVHEGYGGYCEFRLIFLPGNHRGLHEPTVNPSSPSRVWGNNNFKRVLPCYDSGAFIVNTSLSDLENLRKAIGKAIGYAKRKKMKPKS